MESEDLPVIKQTGNGDYDSGNLRTDLESLPILLRNIGKFNFVLLTPSMCILKTVHY